MEEKKVPALRFRGFDNAWEQRRLGELADKVTEKNTLLAKTEVLTNSAEFGIINQREFFDHDIVNENNIGGYYIVRERDFVYNPRISVSAPVGPINCNKLGKSGVMSPLYTVFRVHDIDSVYLEYFFKTSRWHSFMRFNGDSGVRSDRFSIKTELFYKMPIPITKYCEQVKIGKHFSKLDHLISLHQRKLEMLKKVKKSMLEKMFPKNDAKVPEVRFSDFTDAWEQKKLGEIASVITKGTTPLDKSNVGDVNFVKIENIDEDSGKIVVTQKITNEEHEGYLRRSQLLENDILFSIAGTLGRVTSIESNILPANTNQALAIIRLKYGDLQYIKTYLKGEAVSDYIKKNPTVGAQPNLSLEQVNCLKIAFSSVGEQKKLGSFFSKLDHLISLHQRKLEKLKNIKKSMLEKMFII